MRWSGGIADSTDMSLSELQERRTGKPAVLPSMGSQRVRNALVTEQQPLTIVSSATMNKLIS